MNADHTFFHINNFLGSTGFGLAMGFAVIPALLLAGIKPSKSTIALLIATITLVCICLAAWAQSWRIDRFDPAAVVRVVKIISWTATGVVAAVMGGRLIQAIVERAPPTALLAIFSILAGCVACVGLVLFAPFHNLLLLLCIVLCLALTAAIAILSWAVDRRHAREIGVQHAAAIGHYPAQQERYLPYERQEKYLPREEKRGRLPHYPPENGVDAPAERPKGNLPVVINGNPVEWM